MPEQPLPSAPSSPATPPRRRIVTEIAIVLVITFGVSGLRSAARLITAVVSPQPLNEQSTTIAASQAPQPWLDMFLQLCSSAVLFGWGFLALFLLEYWVVSPWRLGLRRDIAPGIGLAALIGIPGLVLYLAAVHLGWSKQVIPADVSGAWWTIPVLVLWSAANAFAEEVVVVAWLTTRLRQLRIPMWLVIGLSAVLRGSYHLYQGFSAGVGNVVMGVIFAGFYLRSAKIRPLIIAHFLIDAVAFVGYATIGDALPFLNVS